MEERRRNNDLQIEVLTERVTNWMSETTSYRKALCAKMDVLLQRVNDLPCKSSAEERKGIKAEISWLQKGAMAVICTLFGMGVWVGNVNTTVTANSHKWRVLEPEHKELIKDVEVLKEKSYGYRGIQVETKDVKHKI
jgi:hypothetical protein